MPLASKDKVLLLPLLLVVGDPGIIEREVQAPTPVEGTNDHDFNVFFERNIGSAR